MRKILSVLLSICLLGGLLSTPAMAVIDDQEKSIFIASFNVTLLLNDI